MNKKMSSKSVFKCHKYQSSLSNFKAVMNYSQPEVSYLVRHPREMAYFSQILLGGKIYTSYEQDIITRLTLSAVKIMKGDIYSKYHYHRAIKKETSSYGETYRIK